MFWQSLILSPKILSGHFLDEPTITLDQSTLQIIPCHLRKLILSLGRRPTQNDVMNALVMCAAMETGFIGDWCFNDDTDADEVLRGYARNWSFSFDRRMIRDFARMPTYDDSITHKTFKLKFSLWPDNDIHVHSLDSGDFILVMARNADNSVMSSTKSIALPVSRYVISKNINLSNLPVSFRNLRELSMRLKNEIFLPLRNNILGSTPNPSLQGIDLDVILPYLKRKDVVSLASTCKSISAFCVPYITRNKSKNK